MNNGTARWYTLLILICFLQTRLLAFSGKPRTASPKQASAPAAGSLEQLSTALQSVAENVEPAVVQIFNSNFAIEADANHGGTVVSEQKTSGSGILITPDGYIVTNAHVVRGARRLWVRLNQGASPVPSHLQMAKLVGMDQQTDLAVIKIDLTGLPFLKFADSSTLKQGQIVLAFGSPLGLENSVSMGVISAVDRQIDADSPLVFIQTDAAINPGNSGGPLVNTAGDIVGVNTFIFTKSGGNEGVGFAIPANLVSAICRQIRVDHHVHHHQVGIFVRAITPALAQGLNLATQDGVVIEDVIPQSPAEHAGLKVGDIVLTVHGRPIPNIRQLAFNMYSYAVGDSAQIEVLRQGQKLSFSVPVLERATGPQAFEDLIGEADSALPRLGILGLTVSDDISPLLPPMRIAGGVLVAAKLAGSRPRLGDDLSVGDIIHGVNGAEIKDVGSLRARLESLNSESLIVIQVERSGMLHFVTLEGD